MGRVSWVAIIVAGLVCSGAPALAQNDAEFGGTVRDASGALVSGAAITVTKLDTETVRTTVTNEEGYFVLSLLPPGEYQVRISKEGFRTLTEAGVILQVNQQARQEFKLEVGQVAEAMNITGSVPLLETATVARGQVIDNKKIVDLPLNGRDYLQLALLSVGAGYVPQGRMNTFSASGQRSWDNTYLLDGVDNNTLQRASQSRRAEVVKPSVDAVEEFKVLTNAYSAEFGRAGGGVVTLTLKSGTNSLHGTLFEFLRNSQVDARNFFAQTNPPFKRNQFGGSAGGPIRKNKTFIFGDYEGTRIRQPPTQVSTVPTALEAMGNFSQLLPGTILYDPFSYNAATKTRTAYPDNTIPAARFDPVGVKLVNLYPKPNLPGLANNFVYNPANTDNIDRGDVRIDHVLSDNNRLLGHYSHSNELTGSSPDLPAPAWGNSANATPFTYTGQSGMAGYDHVFSPSFLMESKVAWNKIMADRQSPISYNQNAQLGIGGVDNTEPGMAGIPVTGYKGLGLGANIPNLSTSENRQMVFNMTNIRGTHTLKWGVNLNWVQQFLTNPQFALGTFTFNGSYTRDPVTARGGNGLADLLLGTVASGQVSNWSWSDLRRQFYDFYVQDEWRITSRLTFLRGLRYELHPQWVDRKNMLDNVFFRADGTAAMVLAKDGSRYDRALVNTDYKNFSPRIGLAYQATQKLVLRAGFGIYYGNDIGNINFGLNPPFNYTAQVSADPVTPSIFIRTGLPPNLATAANASNLSLNANDPNRRNPYNQQWNFTMQQQLTGTLLLEVGYVGASAHFIQQTNDINAPPPGPGAVNPRRPVRSVVVPPNNVVVGPLSSISYETGNANANYNALQTRLEKRLARGLSASINYVFSKTISDSTGGASVGTTSNSPQNPRNLRAERALADEYFKHRFVGSYVYDLPLGRGRSFMKNANSVLDAIAGGWTMAGILTRQSGLRVDLRVQGNPSNIGSNADRPNVLHNWYLGPDQRTIQHWFDTTAFAANPAYTFGNAGRNLIGGPPMFNLDFALYKTQRITERVRLQIRAEAFNSTNTPFFGSPNATVGTPGIGSISSAASPRNLQIGLKTIF